MPIPLIPLLAGLFAGNEGQKTAAKKKRSAAAKKGAATRKANAAKKNARR
jgi:hypothetical protein